MTETEKLKNEDLRRKNFIIFIAFSIAVLGALLVTFIHKDFYYIISLKIDYIKETEKLKNEDLMRKNFIIFIAFSIAVLGALLVTFIHKDFDHSIIYASGLIIYLLSYVIIKLTKKETLFPIAMIV